MLALFLYQPDLARQPIDAGEGTMLPAGEVCPATQFTDAHNRQLAEMLLDAIDFGENPDVGRLILDAPDDRVGALAAELSRLGQALIENCDIDTLSFLARICSELQQVTQLERFDSGRGEDPAEDPGAELKRRMERLRERGLDKAAIAQARPRKPMRVSAGKNTNWNNKGRR